MHLPGIRSVLFRVMGLVKNEKVDLVDRDERMHETLGQYLGSADNDHVFVEHLPPSLPCP